MSGGDTRTCPVARVVEVDGEGARLVLCLP